MKVKKMTKKIFSLILLVCFLNINVPFAFGADVILEKGTKIRLKLLDKVSSGFNQEGDEVNLTVTDDVKLGDTVIIKEGTQAKAMITELTPRGRIGKAGKMTLNVYETKAVNGKTVPLNALVCKKGEDKFVISVALSILLAPIGLCALLMSGENAQLYPGYQIVARLDDDIVLVFKDEN